LFHKDDLVFVDKHHLNKPSKLEPRYWGPYIVTDVLQPFNEVKIRYDQRLEEIVIADRMVKYNPRMMPNIKELTAFDKEFNPNIQVPTYLRFGSRIQDDKESEALEEHQEDEHSNKIPHVRIPRSKIVFEPEPEGSKRRTRGTKH